MNVRETFLYSTEQCDFNVSMHSVQLRWKIQIHLDAASL